MEYPVDEAFIGAKLWIYNNSNSLVAVYWRIGTEKASASILKAGEQAVIIADQPYFTLDIMQMGVKKRIALLNAPCEIPCEEVVCLSILDLYSSR